MDRATAGQPTLGAQRAQLQAMAVSGQGIGKPLDGVEAVTGAAWQGRYSSVV